MTPPHEHWQAPWLNMWSLIHTMPASSSRAIRSPLLRSEVHTEAPRPNSESLASAHRLVLGVDDDDRQHRAEDLLAHDPHLVRDAGEHRRRVEAASDGHAGRRLRDGPAAVQRRARRDRVVDQLAHDLELLARDHRADLGVPAERIADPQPLGPRDDLGDEPLGHLAHHVHPLDPRARLAGVGEAAPQRAGDRVLEVGVAEHDHRILAAELEHRALQLPRALLTDAAAGLDRAGEEHLGHAGLHERGAGARAVDDAHEALGHAGALEHLARSARRSAASATPA